MTGLLAVVTARHGSRGLPGKNLRLLAGLPLIAHSILLARQCSEVERLVVSTDSEEIAEVGRRFGADVPFLRSPALAQDDTPIWPVLRHALEAVEQIDRGRFEYVLFLDPTSPLRLPSDVAGAFRRLAASPQAEGVIAVSRLALDPAADFVVQDRGWLKPMSAVRLVNARPGEPVYRINGLVYIWRAEFVRTQEGWRHGKLLLYEVPALRALSIDDIHLFEQAEGLLRSRCVTLPWLHTASAAG